MSRGVDAYRDGIQAGNLERDDEERVWFSCDGRAFRKGWRQSAATIGVVLLDAAFGDVSGGSVALEQAEASAGAVACARGALTAVASGTLVGAVRGAVTGDTADLLVCITECFAACSGTRGDTAVATRRGVVGECAGGAQGVDRGATAVADIAFCLGRGQLVAWVAVVLALSVGVEA